MFTFIKAVSDTVCNMINTLIVYHEKSLTSIGVRFRKKLVSHHRAVNEADYCLHIQ